MKKLLLLFCLLPLAGLAQRTVIKEVALPRLMVDSVTRLRTLRLGDPVPGAKKDNLTALLNKWLRANYTQAGTDAAALDGAGGFSGSCAAQRAQYDINNTDRLATAIPPVDYKVTFAIKVIVTDEKYAIVINNLKLELFNVYTPFEEFYKGRIPEIPVPEEQQETDIGALYVTMFEHINASLQDVGRSASKYIAKAKKRGEI